MNSIHSASPRYGRWENKSLNDLKTPLSQKLTNPQKKLLDKAMQRVNQLHIHGAENTDKFPPRANEGELEELLPRLDFRSLLAVRDAIGHLPTFIASKPLENAFATAMENFARQLDT